MSKQARAARQKAQFDAAIRQTSERMMNAAPAATRQGPLLHDVNFWPDPEDVRAWIARALRQ
jgi:hypothetical protein